MSSSEQAAAPAPRLFVTCGHRQRVAPASQGGGCRGNLPCRTFVLDRQLLGWLENKLASCLRCSVMGPEQPPTAGPPGSVCSECRLH